MKKSDREIMEILEAFDATGRAHSAAQLAGVDPKTVRRYVSARDAGRPVTGPGVTYIDKLALDGIAPRSGPSATLRQRAVVPHVKVPAKLGPCLR